MADTETLPDSNKLQVRLVTPDRILVDQQADAVELPAKTGYLEVLFGAAPLLAELGAGEVHLHGGEGQQQTYFVARGFVEVLPERVTILAETALKPEEIDSAQAKQQIEEGHKLWNEAGEDAEKYKQANELVAEAESKLESASHKS